VILANYDPNVPHRLRRIVAKRNFREAPFVAFAFLGPQDLAEFCARVLERAQKGVARPCKVVAGVEGQNASRALVPDLNRRLAPRQTPAMRKLELRCCQ